MSQPTSKRLVTEQQLALLTLGQVAETATIKRFSNTDKAKLDGLSGGGGVFYWYGPGGTYAALPASKPTGTLKVEAEGPQPPVGPYPAWVGNDISNGKVPLGYTRNDLLT